MSQKYPPAHHQVDDRDKMIQLIRNFPLGMLVTTNGMEPFITHIPIIYNQEIDRLVAHIDKYNPQVETLIQGAEVKVVFKGPDVYISPSVYTTTQLPTWNYLIVHVRGRISKIHDRESAKDTMIAMTEFLEEPDHKFVLEKENPRMEAAVNYIKAFDIEITHWEGKFKLSQDKHKKDQINAKQALMDNAPSHQRNFIEDMYRE